MNDADFARLRAGLIAVLSGIERAVKQSATTRCPYLRMDERCSFSRGCRNQVPYADTLFCSRPPLNAAPPGSHDLP